jgi:TolB protein
MRIVRSLVLALVVVPSAAAAQQRLRIEVGGPNFRPYPVAVPAPVVLESKGGGAAQLAKELGNTLQLGVDLARSLELVPPASYLGADKEAWAQPRYANWLNVGASGLIRCGIELNVTRVKTTCRFFDVVGQRESLTKTYEVTSETVSRAAHQFLDEVVELLTAEKGIFSSKLAFVKKTKKGKAVFMSDVDGKNEVRLTDPAALSLLPGWGNIGKHILFTSYLQNNPDLYRLRIADSSLEMISNRRGLNTGAAVSPDGKRIAFTMSTDGNTEIYVMDWTGANPVRLTDNWGQDVSPTWSPDGKRLAFVSSRSGQPHIYVMNADGGSPTRLTFQGTYNQEPDWSPRPGGQIAFTARDEFLKYDIFLVHPDTGTISRLTQDDGDNQSPAHSPDGHHILFVSTRPPQQGSKLYVMDIDGSNQRRLASGGDYETPAWGPRLGWD